MSNDKTYNVLNYLTQPRNAIGLPQTGKVNNTLVIDGDTAINGTTRTAQELDQALQDNSGLEPRVDALETDVATNTTNITTNTQDIDLIEAQVLQNGILTTSDGLSSNLISAASATSLNIKGGTGQIIDRTGILSGTQPTRTVVSWADETNVDITPLLPSPDGNFAVIKDISGNTLIVDNNGATLISSEQYKNFIQLGAIAVNGGALSNVSSGAFPAYGNGIQFYPLSSTVGVVNSRLNPISIEPSIANPANLRFKINAGEAYSTIGGFSADPLLPNVITRPADQDPQTGTALALRTGAFSFSATNEINPNLKETSPGVTVAVGNGRFSLQRIFLFPASGLIGTFYGTTDFNTLQQAIDRAYTSGVPNAAVTSSAVHIANLAIQQGTIDFSQPNVQFSLFDPN